MNQAYLSYAMFDKNQSHYINRTINCLFYKRPSIFRVEGSFFKNELDEFTKEFFCLKEKGSIYFTYTALLTADTPFSLKASIAK
jgi:hypothetical protein